MSLSKEDLKKIGNIVGITGKYLDSKIKLLDSKWEKRFEKIGLKFDNLDERFDRIESKIDRLINKKLLRRLKFSNRV